MWDLTCHHCAEVEGNQGSVYGVLFQGKKGERGTKNPATKHVSSLKHKPSRANKEVKGKGPFKNALPTKRNNMRPASHGLPN